MIRMPRIPRCCVWLFAFLMTAPSLGQSSDLSGPDPSWSPMLTDAFRLTWGPSSYVQEQIELFSRSGPSQSLAEYVAYMTARLEKDGLLMGRDKPELDFEYTEYRDLAVANLLLFIQNGDTRALHGAEAAIDVVFEREDDPLNKLWHHLIMAYVHLDARYSKGFVDSIFNLWLDVLLEQQQIRDSVPIQKIDLTRDLPGRLPYVYLNVAHLIRKALVGEILEDEELEALVVVVEDLGRQMIDGRYGGEKEERLRDLEMWIALIVQHFEGIDSDERGLRFAAAYGEANELWAVLYEKWAGASIREREISFDDILKFYILARDGSRTEHGRISAQTGILSLTNFALDQSYVQSGEAAQDESHVAPPFGGEEFMEESGERVAEGLTMLNELGSLNLQGRGWRAAGYRNRDLFLRSTHKLWREAMSTTLLIFDSHDDGAFGTIEELRLLPPTYIEMPVHYLNMFHSYTALGHQEFVPDDAYFGAVEALTRIARLTERQAKWSQNRKLADTSLDFWKLSIEIYPFDYQRILDLADYLFANNRYGYYRDEIYPLADRLNASTTLLARAGLTDGSQQIDLLRKSIPDLIRLVYDEGLQLNTDLTLASTNSPKLIEVVEALQNADLPNFDYLVGNRDDPIHSILKDLYQEMERQEEMQGALELAAHVFPGGR